MEKLQSADPAVIRAINALQAGDRKAWLAEFADKVELLDDGAPRDFARFTREAVGAERFISIDAVGDKGMSVHGRFHSEAWGDFTTYFRFHRGPSGRFDKLEIGQA